MNDNIISNKELNQLLSKSINSYINKKISFYQECLIDLQSQLDQENKKEFPNTSFINTIQGQMQVYYSNIKSMRIDQETLTNNLNDNAS